jgi:adenine-specific DNA-methyltransferase
MSNIDNKLILFDKCDIFTPDQISKTMSSYLHKHGSMLEPAVGIGNLLKYITISNYDVIDIFDIKQKYLDNCINNYNIHKHCQDFIETKIEKKYDNIILNPPYIKIQDLSTDYRRLIKNKYPLFSKGSFDLYIIFMIKCIELLNDNGILVAIIPNSFLYNKTSTQFRQYLIDNTFIKEIIDHEDEKVFLGVSVYTCIIIISKLQNKTFLYNKKIIQYDDICKVSYNMFIKKTLKTTTLGSICKIRNGVATLCNKVYIHEFPLSAEQCWKNIFTPAGNKYIIYPYDENCKIINENTFKHVYKNTYEYLLYNQEILSKRDKGNKTYPIWYAYGRTQALQIPTLYKTLFISNFINPNNFKVSIETSKLCSGCLSIELTDDKYTYEYIEQLIRSNITYLKNCSPKKSGGWINISSKTLANLELN